MEELSVSGKSYVATLNAENFASLQPHLPRDTWEQLREAVILELHGDDESQKLLGRQFDGS